MERGDQALGQWEAVVPSTEVGVGQVQESLGLPGWGGGLKGRMGTAADTAPMRVDRRGEWLQVPSPGDEA